MRYFSAIMMLSLLILSACDFEQNNDQYIVDYEYLSKEDEIPDDVTQWLINIDSEDRRIHSLTLEEGTTYVYANQHKKAKVSYIDENIEGESNQSMKVTLLKGSNKDTVFIKISYETDLCCDSEILDATENEKEFYEKQK
ncbi:hypothetical protein IMZ31_22115 (plasmid) [Pontibacillus sp. ALD_SL1]|uniref:hypothetical protein n=1 Tax=Pontibacillus sp. ALD_SL1 TaxID=2777185 RepID=UPI001A975F2C|nr:hypothetical protein [Pontibacillus sp. ALD_SL1]QST02150.1 hypothetical protein IMZ31_22115 [Pontibacillus sp. ALD_SL1]